jgi:uncharacterized DUF497 family protein
VHIWDENKRLANIVNHGVDFRDLVRLDWDTPWFSRIGGEIMARLG